METKRPHIPADLPTLWRDRAEWLRDYGDPNSARLWLSAARELEAALQAHNEETYSLTEAAKLSGFTADHLSQLVKRAYSERWTSWCSKDPNELRKPHIVYIRENRSRGLGPPSYYPRGRSRGRLHVLEGQAERVVMSRLDLRRL